MWSHVTASVGSLRSWYVRHTLLLNKTDDCGMQKHYKISRKGLGMDLLALTNFHLHSPYPQWESL